MDEIEREFQKKTGSKQPDAMYGVCHNVGEWKEELEYQENFTEYLKSALQSARDELEKYKKACDQAADNIEKWIKWGQEDEEKIDTLKAEAARMREVFGNLLLSHGYFTQREYESDPTYNESSIGYKEEENAIEVFRDIYGEQSLSDLFAQPAAPEKPETCRWEQDWENEKKIFVTSCGNTIAYVPHYLKHPCPYCEKPIAEGEEI